MRGLNASQLQELDTLEVFGKKKELKENRKKEVERLLREVYSPINHMIEDMMEYIALGDENGIGFVGGFVELIQLSNFAEVRQIFIDHGYEFAQATRQKWRIKTRLTNQGGITGIYVDKDLADLLRELDMEYWRLYKELKTLSTEK